MKELFSEPLMSIEELVRFLALEDQRSVYELTRTRAKRRLPSYRVGKVLRFSRREVIAWLEAQRT